MPHLTLQSRRSTETRILPVAGLRMLVELAWYPLENTKDSSRPEALYAHLLSDCAIYACQSLGLGRLPEQKRARLSLAAWLARQLDDAIVLLPLRDDQAELVFWLFVKWHGQLLAGFCDNCYASLAEGQLALQAVETLVKELSSPGEACPTVFWAKDQEESQDFLHKFSLPSFWERVRGRYAVSFGKIPPQGLQARLFAYGRFFLPLLVLWAGYNFFLQEELEESRSESCKSSLSKPDLAALFGEPWQDGPWAGELTELLPYLDSLPLDYLGWRLNGFEAIFSPKIRDVQLNLNYSATRASAYTNLAAYDTISGKDSLKRHLRYRLSGQSSLHNRTLEPVASYERRIWQWQRELALTCSLVFEQACAKVLPGQGRFHAPWRSGRVRWTALSAAQLSELLPHLTELHGFVLRKFSYAEGKYSLEGLIYGLDRPLSAKQ